MSDLWLGVPGARRRTILFQRLPSVRVPKAVPFRSASWVILQRTNRPLTVAQTRRGGAPCLSSRHHDVVDFDPAVSCARTMVLGPRERGSCERAARHATA